MTMHPVSISVTNLQHSYLSHLRKDWIPCEVTVATDLGTVALIKGAHRLATENATAGVIAPVKPSDFTMTFLNYDKEEIQITADFFTARVTADTLYIELFDERMELSPPYEPMDIAAYIRVACSLKGLID